MYIYIYTGLSFHIVENELCVYLILQMFQQSGCCWFS